jgi:PAS domain S-box-containing protein
MLTKSVKPLFAGSLERPAERNPQCEEKLSDDASFVPRMMVMQAFGQYTMSSNPHEVRQGDRLVRLTPRQLKVLALLIRARGKTVSKDNFFSVVWRGRLVEDANLSQTVFLIRRALGKLPDGSDYIETMPGHGYRLSEGALPKHSAKTGSYQLGSIEPSGLRSLPGELDFRLLVDSIEDYAIYLLDCTGRVLTWNRGAELNKGYTPSEVLGQHYSLFFVPEDVESGIPDREVGIAAVNGRCAGEGWRIRKNGERFWASFALTAIRSEAGKLLGYAKVIRDISDRKRHEDALLRLEAVLRRERDRLRAVANSSMDAVYICEAVRDRIGEIEDFVFTYVNENVEDMVRIPRERLLGGRMCELFPLHRSTGLFEAYKQVVITGKPFLTEVSAQDVNIKIEWARVKVVPSEDGVAITVSDISARKLAEERLAQLST